jgi:hypothetical protein
MTRRNSERDGSQGCNNGDELRERTWGERSEHTIPLRPLGPYLNEKGRPIGYSRHNTGKESKRKGDDELTKSSNPSSVPLNSRSFFMMTQIFEPIHLSMSSASRQIWTPFETEVIDVYTPNGRTWEVMVVDQQEMRCALREADLDQCDY